MLVQQAARTDDGWPILRFPAQAPLHGIDGRLVRRVWERDGVVRIDDRLQLLHNVQVGEGRPAVDHLIQDAT